MPTQRAEENNNSERFLSCDLMSFVCDNTTTGSEPGEELVFYERKLNDIDCLSNKLDSIDLMQEEQKNRIRFDEFEVSGAHSGVDIYNAVVECRGPCVDVQKVYKKDDDGDTLLHIALIILAPELAFYFIDMAPQCTWLNIQNKLSQAPLHLAVLTKQVALVRRLVVAGANLESRDKDGNMAIHLACRNNLLDVVRALLEPVRYEEQKRNNYDIPYQKVPQNLEAKNYEGLTALHVASLLNNEEIVRTLIDSGANINNTAEKSGRTILHEAAWSGNLNLVKYLISLGKRCNINAKTYDGYTAFDFARSRGQWSVVIELATAGATADEDGME